MQYPAFSQAVMAAVCKTSSATESEVPFMQVRQMYLLVSAGARPMIVW